MLAFIIDYDGKTTIEYMPTIIIPYTWKFLQYVNFAHFAVTYKYSKNLINETSPVCNICNVYQDFQDVLDDNLHSKHCYRAMHPPLSILSAAASVVITSS